MRDGLAAGDRVQLHINNGKKKAYTRNGLDWIKRFSVGRSACVYRKPTHGRSCDEVRPGWLLIPVQAAHHNEMMSPAVTE